MTPIWTYFALGALAASVACVLYHVEQAASTPAIARIVLGVLMFGVVVGLVGPIALAVWR